MNPIELPRSERPPAGRSSRQLRDTAQPHDLRSKPVVQWALNLLFVCIYLAYAALGIYLSISLGRVALEGAGVALEMIDRL